MTTLKQAYNSDIDNDDDLIKSWASGRTENTRDAYLRDIRQAFAFIERPLKEWTVELLFDYRDHADAKYAESTATRKMASVKSLCSFAHKLGYIPNNIGNMLECKMPKNKLAQRILPEEEVKRIIAETPAGRNKTILRVFYSTGIRVSELCGLTFGDFYRHGGAGVVEVDGKGNKVRTLRISESVWEDIMALKGPDTDHNDPVFRSREGGPLTRFMVWRIVKSCAKDAGINLDRFPVSPHWFRHAHASHALDKGAPIHLVKKTLGHSSVSTTSRYLHARPDVSSGDYLDA